MHLIFMKSSCNWGKIVDFLISWNFVVLEGFVRGRHLNGKKAKGTPVRFKNVLEPFEFCDFPTGSQKGQG